MLHCFSLACQQKKSCHIEFALLVHLPRVQLSVTVSVQDSASMTILCEGIAGMQGSLTSLFVTSCNCWTSTLGTLI